MDSENGVNEKLGGLVEKATRPDRRLSVEDLLAIEVSMAVVSTPIEKIRHIGEALLLLTDDEKKDAGITPEAEANIYKLCKLATMFRNVFVGKFTTQYGDIIETSMTIQWPFAAKEFKDWASWLAPPGIEINWYNKSREEATAWDIEAKKYTAGAERAYHFTHARKLTIDSVNGLKSHFENAAMPIVIPVLRKLISNIGYATFKEAIANLKLQKGRQTL